MALLKTASVVLQLYSIEWWIHFFCPPRRGGLGWLFGRFHSLNRVWSSSRLGSFRIIATPLRLSVPEMACQSAKFPSLWGSV